MRVEVSYCPHLKHHVVSVTCIKEPVIETRQTGRGLPVLDWKARFQ